VTVRKWDPLRDLLSLQERMNRLFEESFAGRLEEPAVVGSATWTPLADAYETPEAFVVLLELPGIDENDVEVLVDGDTLTVKGQRRALGQRPDRFHRMERSHGPFLRSFQLSEEVDPDRVSAQLREGVLRLELPKLTGRAGSRRDRE
jgi:HSP20 family protein